MLAMNKAHLFQMQNKDFLFPSTLAYSGGNGVV